MSSSNRNLAEQAKMLPQKDRARIARNGQPLRSFATPKLDILGPRYEFTNRSEVPYVKTRMLAYQFCRYHSLMNSGNYLSLLIVVFGLSACVTQTHEDELARGAELLMPFKQVLQQTLASGLKQGSVHAITACQLQAPAIARSLSLKGVVVGRASDRLRNPANASPEWVSPVLNAWLVDSADRQPQIVALTDKRLGYIEPILLKPLCLTCHGSNLAPEITARIGELYPHDQATGFKAGDLRGVFWIEFPDGE